MKNNLTILIALFLFSSLMTAQDSIEVRAKDTSFDKTTLTVEVVNLKNDKGQLLVGLYSDSGSWLGKAYKGEISQIESGKASLVFTDLPYGVYGVSIVHDQDSNQKMNTGLFGIPTEPYACSRGAKGKFGPPKWEDAQFELSATTALEVVKF